MRLVSKPSMFHNHGPLKCIQACKRRSGCDAVNYKRDALECELLEAPSTDDRILTDDSYWFANKSHWNLVSILLCKLHITTTYK
jgi:hypothetical protein